MTTTPFGTPVNTLQLSVLDLVPVRSRQTSEQAIGSSLDLVGEAERLGYARYWFAEHHNMPAVASTSPPVLVAAAAARTGTIRVGSGGVMLPNHSPLVVAEQFAAAEAIAPGRIDLGLGRAPGSDPIITQFLRMSGTSSDVERFPEFVRNIQALISPAGASLQLTSGTEYTITATPAATSAPEIWLLGSSDYSAQLAAALGLPYVFANHFSGHGLDQALGVYRSQYRPSERHPEPVTFLTANVVVAPTAEEAEERSLPNQRTMARLRTNRPLGPQETVDEALADADDFDAVAQQVMAAARSTWFVGTGETVLSELRAFATKHGVNEVMISPVAGAYEREPLGEHPGRLQTLRLLADAVTAS